VSGHVSEVRLRVRYAETDRMAASIMQLARASHQLPEDMRAGIDVLAGKGMDPRQAIQMIGPIGRLATAMKVDLADGSAAAFANLNNLQVSLADTTKGLDIMALGSKIGSFEVADMAADAAGVAVGWLVAPPRIPNYLQGMGKLLQSA